jgi:hypothetical protein
MKKITGTLLLHLAIIFVPLKTIAQRCNISGLQPIQFNGSSSSPSISKEAQDVLRKVALQIRNHPTCRVRVTGHGASDKREQQLSWDRVNAVIRYLVESQGIGGNRFIFEYGTQGDRNTVDLSGTLEEGPESVPAPHPNLRPRVTLNDVKNKSEKQVKKVTFSKSKLKK